MSEDLDYRYWTADAIRANRPARSVDTAADLTVDGAVAPVAVPDVVPVTGPATAPSVLQRPFAAFLTETDAPAHPEQPRREASSDAPTAVAMEPVAPPVVTVPAQTAPLETAPLETAPVPHRPVHAAPAPPELPPPAPGPLRRVARPAAPLLTPAQPGFVPEPPRPAVDALPQDYRSSFAAQQAPLADVPRPGPRAARRGRGRGLLLVLSHVVVIALAAVATHLYWPTHKAATTTAPVVHSAPTGVLYSSPAGHFRARFPAAPAVVSDQDTVLGTHVVVHGAGDSVDQTLVDEIRLSQPIALKEYTTFLTSVLRGAAASDFVLRSERATTFRGLPARIGSYTATADASQVSILTFMVTSSRAYFLAAPTGAEMTALQTSFVMLP